MIKTSAIDSNTFDTSPPPSSHQFHHIIIEKKLPTANSKLMHPNHSTPPQAIKPTCWQFPSSTTTTTTIILKLYIVPVEFRGAFRELLPLQLHLKRLCDVWHDEGIGGCRGLLQVARRRFRPVGVERICRLCPRWHFPLLQRANCRICRRRQSPAQQRGQRRNSGRWRWHRTRRHAAQPLIGLRQSRRDRYRLDLSNENLMSKNFKSLMLNDFL